MRSNKIGGGGGFGVEGGDGFDEAGDGKGVADAAGAADKAELAPNAIESGGDTNERRDAGTVNLRDAIEIDDDFARAGFENGLQRGSELLGGFSDGQAAVEFEEIDARFLADVDFDGSKVRHWQMVDGLEPILRKNGIIRCPGKDG